MRENGCEKPLCCVVLHVGSQNSRERVPLFHSARAKLSTKCGQSEKDCGQRGWRLAQEHSALGLLLR